MCVKEKQCNIKPRPSQSPSEEHWLHPYLLLIDLSFDEMNYFSSTDHVLVHYFSMPPKVKNTTPFIVNISRRTFLCVNFKRFELHKRYSQIDRFQVVVCGLMINSIFVDFSKMSFPKMSLPFVFSAKSIYPWCFHILESHL